MIVVDSNVLAYFYLPGEYTDAAKHLFARNPSWNAPILWRSEFCNILAGYLRRGHLTFEQAVEIQLEDKSLLEGAEHEPDSKRVLELVHAINCSAYDCEFAALADALGTSLVTMDAKLLKAFPKIAKSLIAGYARGKRPTARVAGWRSA